MADRNKILEETNSAIVELIRTLRSSPSFVVYVAITLIIQTINWFIIIHYYAKHFYAHNPVWIVIVYSFGISIATFILTSFGLSIVLDLSRLKRQEHTLFFLSGLLALLMTYAAVVGSHLLSMLELNDVVWPGKVPISVPGFIRAYGILTFAITVFFAVASFVFNEVESLKKLRELRRRKRAEDNGETQEEAVSEVVTSENEEEVERPNLNIAYSYYTARQNQ